MHLILKYDHISRQDHLFRTFKFSLLEKKKIIYVFKIKINFNYYAERLQENGENEVLEYSIKVFITI